jgi:thiol peroxidase
MRRIERGKHYKAGDFGRATGLLMDDLKLLARSVILVDKAGTVRYIQVVPEVIRLSDRERAFEKAA